MLNELVVKNRAYRRFFEERQIGRQTLESLVENARHCASTSNLQPLRYHLVDSDGPRAAVFDCLKWAGYLTDWPGPVEGERPSGYIVITRDSEVQMKAEYLWCDAGIASQTLLLSASEMGLGGCIIVSIDRDQLRAALSIAERYEILLVIALGSPKEKVVITDVPESGSIKYYRDAEGTHFVPKRALKDILIG
ncbi:nitroreductase family protein [Salinispira pacifica]